MSVNILGHVRTSCDESGVWAYLNDDLDLPALAAEYAFGLIETHPFLDRDGLAGWIGSHVQEHSDEILIPFLAPKSSQLPPPSRCLSSSNQFVTTM